MTNLMDRCRATLSRAPSPGREDRAPYGWDRIRAGAALLDIFDPGWWLEDAQPAVDLATLDMADPCACVLGQRFALAVRVRPYEVGLVVLGLLPSDAARYGFTGVDADMLTPGWRRLIAARRGCRDRERDWLHL